MNDSAPTPAADGAAASPALDLQKATAFALKVIGDVTACQIGTLNLVANRLGLFSALAQAGAVAVEEFAERAGIHARYAREWLSAMACHGYVVFDDVTKKFHLPPEHALALAHPDSRSI